MRPIHLASTAALALAPTAAFAQSPPATDAILQRLQELESKVATLEARNAALETQAAATTDRVKTVETRTAKAVQAGAAPIF
jgi:phosphate-selective porin OprO/OprP